MQHIFRRYLGPCYSECREAFEIGKLSRTLHSNLLFFDMVLYNNRNPKLHAQLAAVLSIVPSGSNQQLSLTTLLVVSPSEDAERFWDLGL
jgi:hypothetical protein